MVAAKINIILISIVLLYGTILGLYNNEPINALNEALAMSPLFLLPLIFSINLEDHLKIASYTWKILILICFIKLIFEPNCFLSEL